ncbi:MAG: type VI secretion system baseplate subunit TssE [Methylococcaceae bacterium]|nr:type VI secretion system baseplate subunit TssE [Methylococcaceae bacterium]
MAELTPQERLQPSLLDRLADDEPDQQQESREQRVLSVRRLRQSVLRDIAWLLNSVSLDAAQNLDAFPEAASSVVNFGIPDLSGHTVSSADVPLLERCIRQAIINFEPRILPNTLKVKVHTTEQFNYNAMSFDIEGDLWMQPLPLRLFLKTEVDLETGSVEISDQTR